MTFTVRDNDYIEQITSAGSMLEALGVYMEANTPREEMQGVFVKVTENEVRAATKHHLIIVRPVSQRVAA